LQGRQTVNIYVILKNVGFKSVLFIFLTKYLQSMLKALTMYLYIISIFDKKYVQKKQKFYLK